MDRIDPNRSKSLLWKISIVIGIFTFLGFLFAGQMYLFVNTIIPPPMDDFNHHPPPFQPISFLWALALSFSDWYLWAALTPIIIMISQRYPIRPERMIADVTINMAISLFFMLIKAFDDALNSLFLGWPPEVHGPFIKRILLLLSGRFHTSLLIYWGILGVIYFMNYYQKFRERELRTSQLETQLAQAQLQVLKMQLHPHFLFNTLNAISTLIYKDVEAADRMITRLSDLLRYTLQNIGIQEVSLREELEFLKRYMEIEQIRFQDRLTIEFDIDPKSLEAQVPTMILQPLVENSIRHGIAKRAQAGRIQIRTKREKETLQLQIRDNGPGAGDDQNGTFLEGIGLTNTKQRLQQLYGSSHHFEMGPAPGGGMAVNFDIPFQSAIQRTIAYGK